jgi:plasmid stabilization system protein ParE
MGEHCVVRFTRAATKDLAQLGRRDARHLLAIETLVERVEEQGWKLSTNAEAIKVLRSRTCVGEMREMGRGGHRLFFFWSDEGDVRTLQVCRVLAKKDVVGTRRLNAVCDAVEARRTRFLQEGDDDG